MTAASTSPSEPTRSREHEKLSSVDNIMEYAWVESLGVPVFVIDFSQYVLAWNQRVVQTTGILARDIVGRPLNSILRNSSENILQNALDAINGGCTSVTCDITIEWQDELRHTNLKVCQGQGSNGQIPPVICFPETADETSTTLATNPIPNDSTTKTTAGEVLGTLDFPAFTTTPKGVITMWNSEIEALTGHPRCEAIGRQLCDFLPDDRNRRDLQEALASACVGRKLNPLTLAILLHNGELQHILLTLSSNRDSRGKVCGACGIAVPGDLGESDDTRVIHRSALHESPSKTPAGNHNGLELVSEIGLSLNGSIDQWSTSATELLGFQREVVLGQSILEFLVPHDTRQPFHGLFETALSGSTTANFVLDLNMENGETRRLLLDASPRVGLNDQINGVSVYVRTQMAMYTGQVASAEELRNLVDTANAAIFGVDASGYVIEWNVKIAEILDVSEAEALNQPLIETFLEEEMQQPVWDILHNALKGRGTSNFELEIRTRAGDLRCLLTNTTPIRDSTGNVVGVFAIAQDITESCKHERAVAAMANELRQLIETANVPIFGIDRDGDVNEWNDKTAEITEYSKEEAFDCSLVETFIVPSMRDSVQDILSSALDGRGTSNHHLEFRTKSDEIRHLLVNATTRRDAENTVVGVLIVAQDVSEAVQRDRAVQGMALELRQLIDTANAPIFGIDSDGNINEWNRRTSEITGFTKEEAFDEPLVEKFIADSMKDKVRDMLDTALAGNETPTYELEFVSKSGEPVFLLVNPTTRRDPENAVVGVVGVAQDVTEDRKHEKELKKMQYIKASQEAKVETERNMTAYFAHELRNPLGAIDSALNAMPDNLPDSARSLISGMQLCSGFMSSIMNNLLDVRKMEEGKMKLGKAPISLKKLLSNVHKMLSPSVRPGVEFTKVSNSKGKDWVLGDAHRIQQVMTNVVTNAIKYTVTGSISLVMGWEDDKVRFECIDTGPGIPKSEQQKLFQRFVQRGGAPGTGLGLAIAKHLVDLTGGSIRFDSDPTVKAGTTCVVLMALPLCDAPDSIEEESSALIEDPLAFLIIDDIKMNRMMLKRRIGKGIAPNATITEAATGEEALGICGESSFDVIVVDQYMEEAGGVMVGTDVVFAMRRMKIDAVIVGCSGNDMGTQFVEAGADWVWQKPMPSNTKIIQDLRASLNRRARARLEQE